MDCLLNLETCVVIRSLCILNEDNDKTKGFVKKIISNDSNKPRYDIICWLSLSEKMHIKACKNFKGLDQAAYLHCLIKDLWQFQCKIACFSTNNCSFLGTPLLKSSELTDGLMHLKYCRKDHEFVTASNPNIHIYFSLHYKSLAILCLLKIRMRMS